MREERNKAELQLCRAEQRKEGSTWPGRQMVNSARVNHKRQMAAATAAAAGKDARQGTRLTIRSRRGRRRMRGTGTAQTEAAS